MRDLFAKNESDFDRLGHMVCGDVRSGSLAEGRLVFIVPRESHLSGGERLSEKRRAVYLSLLTQLSLRGGVGCSGERTWFYVDTPSMLNGSSRRGYLHLTSDGDPIPSVPDIDTFRFSRAERTGSRRDLVCYSRIKPHWYLFEELD
jgi:hypothetical protein